jgi:hypothetical protein
MKTNAKLLPLIGQDQYVIFCLDEIHHKPTLNGAILAPGILAGCEFYTVRFTETATQRVFYLIFHMSNNGAEIIEQLGVVSAVAVPGSITVTTAHKPPDNNARPTLVANTLGIPLANIQHVHNANPIVVVNTLA